MQKFGAVNGACRFLSVIYISGSEALAESSRRTCPSLPLQVRKSESFSGCAILLIRAPVRVSRSSFTIAAVIAILALIYAYLYNRLQDFKLKIDEAESILDEELRNKYDKVYELQTTVLKLSKVNEKEFQELDNIKKEDISNFELDRKVIEVYNKLETIINDYEKIQTKKEVIELLNEIKKLDARIESAKLFYNKYINESNTMVRKFPSNIIAKIHRIQIKNFYDNKDLNDDTVKDFKL